MHVAIASRRRIVGCQMLLCVSGQRRHVSTAAVQFEFDRSRLMPPLPKLSLLSLEVYSRCRRAEIVTRKGSSQLGNCLLSASRTKDSLRPAVGPEIKNLRPPSVQHLFTMRRLRGQRSRLISGPLKLPVQD